MNAGQRAVVVLGCIALVLTAVYPPWVHRYKSIEHPLEYAPIFAPPAGTWETSRGVQVDMRRVLLQILAVLAGTGGLCIVLRGTTRIEESEKQAPDGGAASLSGERRR